MAAETYEIRALPMKYIPLLGEMKNNIQELARASERGPRNVPHGIELKLSTEYPNKDAYAKRPWYQNPHIILPNHFNQYTYWLANVDYESDALKRIYESGRWYGPTELLGFSLAPGTSAQYYLPGFTAARMRCKMRCAHGSECRLCEAYADLAKTLEDRDVNKHNDGAKVTLDSFNQKDQEL